jgi:tetratricopeptide (TPR) repeat protein
MTLQPQTPDADGRQQLIDLTLSGKSSPDLLQLAEKALEAKPDDAIVLAAKGIALQRIGENADSSAALVRAARAASDDYGVWIPLADFLEKTGARDRFVAALSEDGGGDHPPEGWRLLARAQRFSGDLAAALSSFKRATSADEALADTWFEMAWVATDAEQPEQAIEALEKLANLDAAAAASNFARCLKAISLARIDRADAALEALNLVSTAADAADAPQRYLDIAYLEVIEALVTAGNHAAALEVLDRAARTVAGWEPRVRPAWLRGRALLGLGRFADAIEVFDGAEKLAVDDPSLIELRLLQVFAVEMSGNTARALTRLDELFPRYSGTNLAGARVIRSRLLIKLGRYPEALEMIAKLQDEGPPPPELLADVLILRALALNGQGRHEEALLPLQEAQELVGEGPARGLVALLRGRALLSLKRADEALAALSVAYEVASTLADRATARLEQATASELLGQAIDAASFADSALAELSDDAGQIDAKIRALGIKARALQSLGKSADALDVTESLLELRPALRQDLGLVRFYFDLLLAARRFDQLLASVEEATRPGQPHANYPYLLIVRAVAVQLMGGGISELLAAFGAASDVPPEYQTDAAAWLAAGIGRVSQQRWPEAHAAFERLEQLDQTSANNPIVRVYEGMTFNGLEQFDRALERLDGLEAVPGPLQPMAAVIRGQALAGLERFREAVAVFETALTLENVGADPLVAASAYGGKANALIRLGEFEEALPAADAAVNHASRAGSVGQLVYVSGLTTKALALHRLERVEKALDLLDTAIPAAAALPPGSPFRGLAWWSKAIVLVTSDREEEALRAGRRAEREGMPGNEALTVQGDALLVLQDYDRAVEVFQAAVDRARDDEQRFEALSGKGRALHRRHQYEKAVQAYRAAIDLDTKSARTDWLVWQRLGEAYDALDRPRAALRAYQRGWALDVRAKPSPDLALGISAALLKLDQHREAIDFLNKAEKRVKADPRLTFNRGLALFYAKDPESAKPAFLAAASQGIDAAADLLKKLDRKIPSDGVWTDSWFGKTAGWGRRVLGAVLLLAVALVLFVPAVPLLLEGEVDWKALLPAPVFALVLLILPTLKNVSLSVGDLKLQAEPSVPSARDADAVELSRMSPPQPFLSGSAAPVSGQVPASLPRWTAETELISARGVTFSAFPTGGSRRSLTAPAPADRRRP